MSTVAPPRSRGRSHLTMIPPGPERPAQAANPQRRLLVEQLPEAHAVALRLDEAGYGAETIGVALGIAVQGVPGVLEVARAKLRRLERLPPFGTYGERSNSSVS